MFDHEHPPTAAAGAGPQRDPGQELVALSIVLGRRRGAPDRVGASHVEELPTLGEFLAPVAVPQQAVVPNPVESRR